MRAIVAACCTAVVLATSIAAACAEDSDQLRWYFGFRGQDTNPLTEIHDAWGISFGANLNRSFGFELAADQYEHFVKLNGKTFGEFGTVAILPQVRVRYPLLGDRLVPYVVGGVGLALSEFNDRKPPGFGDSIKNRDSSSLVGSFGAGAEYFFADNMAVGVEFKYLLAEDATLQIDGRRHSQEVGGLLTSVALRFFGPELHPRPLAESRAQAPVRIYFGIRAGMAISTHDDVFDSASIKPEPPAYFGTGNQFFGGAIGVNVAQHWGVEFAAEGYEVRLRVPDRGSIGEMAVTDFVPQVRFRYPLMGGRVVPYAIGGVGISYGEYNDRKPPGAGLNVDGNSYGLAAALGAGVEYFLTSNISVGLETRYLTARGHEVKLNTGARQDGDFDAVVIAATLRAYLFDFGER